MDCLQLLTERYPASQCRTQPHHSPIQLKFSCSGPPTWLKNVKCGDPAPFARWSPVWENKDLEKPVEDQEGKGRLRWFSYFFLSRWAIHSQECINLCGVSFSQDSIYFGVVLCEYVMYFPVLRSQYRMYFQPSFSQYGVYLVILKGQYGKYLAA